MDAADENLDVEALEEEVGDPVCWAHLVCPECGAVTTGAHSAGCSRVEPGTCPD